LAAGAIETNGGTVDFGSMAEFDCPSYNADVQRDRGFPAGADELRGRLEASDAFVICAPEYNASMQTCSRTPSTGSPASTHNPSTSDTPCCSRLRRRWSAATEASGLCASPSSISALASNPDMFSLARAHLALDGDGQIANEELRRRFQMTIASFMDLVEASKHYPCVKSALVEYLGEHPEPAIDRVQQTQTDRLRDRRS
jgi:chromate reductase, NAD(P)H dehydrogenase (quinone)